MPNENKLDRRRKYYFVLDCETATLPYAHEFTGEQRKRIAIAKPLIYDLGWKIIDERGRVYRRKNFLNGPGKVCKAFSIARDCNGMDLTGTTLFLCDNLNDAGLPDRTFGRERICTGPRIGIDYAEEAKDFPWRFWLEKEEH